VETGINTKTAGRLKMIEKYVADEDFMLTYGDGVCDINMNQLLEFHKSHSKIATLTAVQLDARFGGMEVEEEGNVISFKEKPKDDGKWINGGFFVLKPGVFKYLNGDMSNVMWEDEPLERLTADNQLQAFRHKGFWKCMDALRDKIDLENLWQTGQAKWKQW
jgi:glucose-1-phosphate cytidylyltransferase